MSYLFDLPLRLAMRLGPLLPAALLTLMSACSDQAPERSASNNGADPITSTPAEWQHELTPVESVGTGRARHSVTLYPEAAGRVEAVHFSAGQRVQEGELLLELETDDEKLAVALAEVELADAKRLLDRYQRTQGSGAVTPADLDEARSAVERAELSLNRAQVALEDRRLRAPFAGHLGLTTIDPGARVTPETEVASLDDRSVLLVTFALPEMVFGQVAHDHEIRLSTWNNRRVNYTGTVVDVDSQVDPEARTFRVRAAVENGDDALRPGMSFRVLLQLQGPEYPLVPEVSLQWGGDGAYVWAVEDGRAHRVAATVVQRREGHILIDADLPESTPVVVEGVQQMREGQSVRQVEPYTTNAEAVTP